MSGGEQVLTCRVGTPFLCSPGASRSRRRKACKTHALEDDGSQSVKPGSKVHHVTKVGFGDVPSRMPRHPCFSASNWS